MSTVPIHFIGFLANVDDSITRLRLADGFAMEKKSGGEVLPFAERIGFQYGFGPLPLALHTPTGYFCITKRVITEFEGIPGVSVIQRPFVFMSGIADVPRNELRLLRLFKEGNAIMRYACLYYEKNSGVEITNVAEERPVEDSAEFTLTETEIPEAQSFIEKYKLPLKGPSAQLAFENFDLSYEVHDAGLAFLSLMNAMEVLLGPNDHYGEITHRISRNAAVLLGRSREEAQDIFKDMKGQYKKRSSIVHGGAGASVTLQEVHKLRAYVRATLKEAMTIGITNKEDMLLTLNSCGFGERPWRIVP